MRPAWAAIMASFAVAGCVADPYANPYMAAGWGPGPYAAPAAGYYGAGYAPYVAGPVIVPGAIGYVEYGRRWDHGRDWDRGRGWDRGRDWDHGRDWDRGRGWDRRGPPPPGWREQPGWQGRPGTFGGGPPPNRPGGGPFPRPPDGTGGVQAPPGTHLVPVPGGPPGGFVVPNNRQLHSPGFPR